MSVRCSKSSTASTCPPANSASMRGLRSRRRCSLPIAIDPPRQSPSSTSVTRPTLRQNLGPAPVDPTLSAGCVHFCGEPYSHLQLPQRVLWPCIETPLGVSVERSLNGHPTTPATTARRRRPAVSQMTCTVRILNDEGYSYGQ